MHSKNSRTWLFILVPVVMVAFRFMNPGAASAQQPVPGAGPAIYQRLAPVNLAGNWVSVVTEDWDIRMIPPAKGDFIGLPLNPAGQKAGNAWDAAKETPADVCKAYAAPALLRMPGRLKINWQDSGNTLQIEADAGQQTRLLHFTGEEPKSEAGWQGYSAAKWEYAGGFDPAAAAMAAAAAPAAGEGRGPDGGGAAGGGRGGRPGRPGRGRATTAQGGALQVVTTHLKPGYLRKNGVPFSKEAVLTEYFNVHADPYGADWLIVTTIVHDPNYLLSDYITSTNFKREPDDSKWRPRPCATP
jgi:hypothetical protein